MLSSADFLEKQLAVITCDQHKTLSLRNENILIKENKKIVNQISCSKLFCVFIIGDCTITTRLIDKLMQYQVNVYYLRYSLKPRFLVGTGLEGNYVLRQKQYTDKHNFPLAKQLVKNKIANQLLLLKALRDKDESLKNTIESVKELYQRADTTTTPDSLRGVEWTVSKLFFGNYFKEMGRYKRMPRTRNDHINLLMDIGYSFLYNFVEANLNLYGFDVYKGVYHTLFYERKSLVCDLIEPFRCLIDKQLRKMHNLWQINPKDFRYVQNEYSIDIEHRVKYIRLLVEPILAHKEAIFKYVKWYYRAVMADMTELEPFYVGE